MKLVIQIPCYNEAVLLPTVLKSLPTAVAGIDEIDVVVIDDGSTDETSTVAQACGVRHVVHFSKNRGLARAFLAGIDAGIRLGADIIVNIDADNQYNPQDIEKLVQPICTGACDITIGERPIRTSREFSFAKKMLQRLGSLVVRMVSRTTVPDAPSGFRAFSRDAALQMNIFSSYTYTLESIIQAGQKNMAIEAVPIRTNKTLRKSRLVKSMIGYVVKSIMTIVRIFVVYKPFAFFLTLGTTLFIAGAGLGVRYLVYCFLGSGRGHIQSVILASILLVAGFQTVLVAFLADLLAVNRKLLEDIQYRIRRQESTKEKI